MIFLAGDTHGFLPEDLWKIKRFAAQQGAKLTRDDYMIELGDFGVCWVGDPDKDPSIRKRLEQAKEKRLDDFKLTHNESDLAYFRMALDSEVEAHLTHDKRALKFWTSMPWTTLFIDGNHENHPLLNSYPVEEWHGGKVHKIADNVIHLMRGQVYEIDGHTFFTMGGASSIDKAKRIEGISWWPEEMPSKEELQEGMDNLEKHDFKVDYVLTHCAPEQYLKNMGMKSMKKKYDYTPNTLTNFFTYLLTKWNLEFGHWYFGHYHNDESKGKFHLLYQNIRTLDPIEIDLSPD